MKPKQVYYWPTPNGHKITLFLEEAGMPYEIIPVHIGQGEQFNPSFLKFSPNNKIPAIIDPAPTGLKRPLSIFEFGAILFYLAEKSGQFLSNDLYERMHVLQWLFWQVAGLGPMAGQNHHFSQYAAEKIPYAIDRYINETARLYAVLNKQLNQSEFIGKDYSIADMACYPWIYLHEKQGQNLNDFPALKRWFETLSARPAVARAYAHSSINPNKTTITEDAKKILFGQNADNIK